ncbi:iron ABC transporter permease [bacterium]|nr:iron ABC transporter permease [bacterium]
MEIATRVKSAGWPKSLIRGVRLNLNGWSVTTCLVVLGVSTPILFVLASLFQASSDVWRHVVNTLLPAYIANSVLLVLGTGALTFLLGVSTAWLLTVYRFPGHRIFEWALILPLAIPTYIVAYTYAGMLDYTGPLQSILRGALGANAGLSVDIMSLPGVILVVSIVLYPYVYVITRASFMQQSSSVFEAAQILGRTRAQMFFQIALPLARPAIVAGLLLVAMETLNDYGAAKYYGVSTFTTGIFRAWFSMGDSDAAIRLCAGLMVFVLLLITLERLQRGKAKFENAASHYRPIRKQALSGWNAKTASLVCFLPLALGFLFPVAQLVFWSYQTGSSVLNHEFMTLLLNSFVMAAAAALLTVLVALVIVYSVRLHQSSIMQHLSKIAILGYSIPGAVIAIGVMLPFARIDAFLSSISAQLDGARGLFLSGTLFMVLFAYLVRFLALALNPLESGFEKSCSRLDEASRSLGTSPLRTLFTINLPLIKSALLAAVILVFVDVLKELPLTLILRPFNFDTLATRAFELASDEMVAESANAALVIIAVGILPVVVVNKLLTRGKLWES